MDCPVCKNEMIKKNVKYFQEWKHENIIIDNVPVIECTVCGERLLDGTTVDKINNILWDLPTAHNKIEVNLYEFV